MAGRFILDASLNSLVHKEHAGVSLPLALRRFAERNDQRLATAAMQAAAEALIKAYHNSNGTQKESISVERLCELAGARVVVPRGMMSSRTTAVVGTSKPHRSHTGSIVFTSGSPRITIPGTVDRATARISVAHELGHLLIHRRSDVWDEGTVRLPATIEEEALAEYGARLLLMPSPLFDKALAKASNLAEAVLNVASIAGVTVHAAVARLGDPDVVTSSVRGAILWRLNPHRDDSATIAERLTPYWHLCPDAFVPIGKCGARAGSLASDLADHSESISGSRLEDVNIGSFTGTFLADGLAWGTIQERTRVVLTVFRLSEGTSQKSRKLGSTTSTDETLLDRITPAGSH